MRAWTVVEVGMDESWWWVGRLVFVGGVAVVADVVSSVDPARVEEV